MNNNLLNMPQHKKALVCRCMDWRLPRKLLDYLEKRWPDTHFYYPGYAGGVKKLLDRDRPSLAEGIWDDIDLAMRNGVDQIILCNHTDCTAYGGSSQFASLEEEKKFQIFEMVKAKGSILARYPKLEIIMILAIIDFAGEVELQEVIF